MTQEFKIVQSSLFPDFVGEYLVTVSASYQGEKGGLEKFKAYFIVTVLPASIIVDDKPPIWIRRSDVIYLDEWEGTVYQAPQESKEGRPWPYIRDFSPTGLMHIGWTDQMSPPVDVN